MPTQAPTRTYAAGVVLAAPYGEAVERTRAAVKEQGFGVITEIDVRATLREKLGGCNPPLAQRALTADLGVGLLLPCNVVVYDNGDGTSMVEALDPEAALRIMGREPGPGRRGQRGEGSPPARPGHAARGLSGRPLALS